MTSQKDVLPLVSERARLEKRDVVTGRVRVSTHTELTDEQVAADLSRRDVEVTRVPVDSVVEAVPAIRTEGDITIVPVVEEILVVEKRLVLREEIHVRTTTTTETVEVPVTLRKQRAVIEREEETEPAIEEDN